MRWPPVLLVATLTVAPAAATEGLERRDYLGAWTAVTPITDGEKTSLVINEDYSVELVRTFNERAGVGSGPQVSSASPDQFRQFEDLIVIDLSAAEHSVHYRLVLSGWRSGEATRIFGTLYLYQDGDLFNGLPVSFAQGRLDLLPRQ